jgi:glycogen(starch) synthase
MSNRPKVLMLGWEFPPLINGGLGVACYGLAKELSKITDLSIILPKADPNFILQNTETIGLNNFDIENLKISSSSRAYTFLNDVDFVNANLLPYQVKEIELFEKKYATTDVTQLKSKLRTDLDVFNTNDLYDGAVGERVYNFAKIATLLAVQKDFDVIHAHDWMTFVAGMEIKAMTGKPLVLHIHSLEIDRNSPESKGWVYQIEKSAMEYADAIIPVSFYTGHMIQTHYGISSEKIFPVHNGIEQVQAFRSESSLPEKVVLFLGRLTGQKGPEYFFETAAKVLEFMPNVRFVMAGSGNMMKGLIEMGAYKHLGNRFHFTGFLTSDKVRQLYSIADVYVMPSVSEPFGLSALEAAQFGVPCVISKQSGVAEVLPSALKADFWDIEKMASNIISILKYKGLRDQLVKDAYHDLSKISWSNSAKHIVDIYKSKFNI